MDSRGLCGGYNVNLIRFNPVGETRFTASPEAVVRAFRDRLQAAGVNVHVRASRGAGVSAACGQLRRRRKQSQ